MKKILCAIMVLLMSAGFVSAAGVPDPPTHLTVWKMPGWALLQWDQSLGAMGYRVYKAVDSSAIFGQIGQVMENHFADGMVSPGHIFRYYVTAFNGIGESVPSNDVVFTPDSTLFPMFPSGAIRGTVVDDSTFLPIRDARLRFFRTNGFMYFREVRTDSLGSYTAVLDTGLYFINASRWQYIPEWYDNVIMLNSATHVAVTESDTSVADFALHQIPVPPEPVRVTVSGTVIDSATGNPLKGAVVVALHTGRQLAEMRDEMGTAFGSRADMIAIPEMGNIWGVVLAVRTDSLGQYSMKLPANERFVFLAARLGHIPQFYKHKSSYEDADILVFTGDSSGINFDLVSNPALNNSISGTVKDSAGNGVISRVVLFSYNELSMTMFPRIVPVRCATTDTLGNYTFKYLFPSSPINRYFVKAYPFGFFAPAWHSIDSCGVRGWRSADSVAVHGDVTGIDVCVREFRPGGFASIAGYVRQSNNQTSLQGTTVYAISMQSGSIDGYDVTAEDGTFSISYLAPGSYQIVVDKEGYQADQLPVYTVDASNNFTVSDASISVTSVLLGVKGGNTQAPAAYTLSPNYPNPFNPTTEISFGIPTSSRIDISIYNLLGQKVATLLTGDLDAGTYSVTWNGVDARDRTVSSGVYFYEMTARSLANASQYSAVRKMLLMK